MRYTFSDLAFSDNLFVILFGNFRIPSFSFFQIFIKEVGERLYTSDVNISNGNMKYPIGTSIFQYIWR